MRPTPLAPFALLCLAASVVTAEPLQEAIDRHPGEPVYVAAGDHPISSPLRLTTAGSGLWGPGRIIQTNPQAAIVESAGAANISIRDVVLTRPDGARDTIRSAIDLVRCPGSEISGVHVIDNWSRAAAISITDCPASQIRDCLVENYMCISVDDRTGTSFLGYAFKCIDGTGIAVKNTVGALVAGNRVIEERLLPTPETKAKYHLGEFVKKNAVKGWHVSQKIWDENYFPAWHQGAALFVGAGTTSDQIQLLGNYVENAAQGVDIHADHVMLANNIITNSFIAMKAVHGSRNVQIEANQFTKNDLWCINLAPGTDSHAAGVVKEVSHGKFSNPAANIDGHSIIAHNILSDFGYGRSQWIWPLNDPKQNSENRDLAPIRLGSNGFAEHGGPPPADVILEGNVLYDPGRDGILVDGKPRTEPPRYLRAVQIAGGADHPVNLLFAGNQFDPGVDGVSNESPPR